MAETIEWGSISATPDTPTADWDEESAVEQRPLLIGAELDGERLDRALAALVPEFSRSYLQQLVQQGAVRLQGRTALKPAQRVRAGQCGSIELRPTAQSRAFVPQVMDLAVVFEDEHLLVIDKPAGLVVHPAPGNWQGTLMNGLLARHADAADLPRAGIVHRLDKDTSGLMVVARSRQAMEALVRALAAREVKRHYLALAHGVWRGGPQRTHLGAVGRDPRNRLRMAVVDLATQSGKPAHTDVCLLRQGPAACMVRCSLHTGRTHQIRVHMADWGHPLLADVLYGGQPAAGIGRQALHATELSFAHPVERTPLVFQRPLPPDLADALPALGLG